MVHVFALITTLTSFVCSYNKKYRNLFFMSFVLLFLFAALRYGFGNDYDSYLSIFNEVKRGGYYTEPLYMLLNLVSPSFYVLIAFTSFIFVFTIYKLVKNNVPLGWSWISVFILLINPYLFLMNLSAIRQCLSLCIFALAVYFSNKHKIIPYCVLIVLAVLFHKSAIILFPLYFFANEKKIPKRVPIIVMLGTLLFLLIPGALLDNIERILISMGYYDYLALFSNADTNSLRATILSAVTYVYILFNLPKLEGKTLMYAKLWMLGSLFSVLAYTMSMFTRIALYFDLFAIVAFPLMLRDLPAKYKGKRIEHVVNVWVLPALIILIFILRYYSFFTNPMWRSFTEYRTIFSVI